MRIAPLRPALVALPAMALGLAACSSTATPSAPSAAATSRPPGQIAVTATDSECRLTSATAPAGVLTFDVTNNGTKVTEFYLYAEGDRILGEVENVAPGLTRQLKVEVTQPAALQTACKPGMVGDGIRAAFAVTGTAAPGSANERVAAAIAAYRAYVATQADELVTGTTAFVAAVKAGDVAKAKALYPVARVPWERIEPVAESFGALDRAIDGREDAATGGKAFTGYHRLEKDLWVSGLQPDSSAIADQLLADVKQIASEATKVTPTGVGVASGAKALLDEVVKNKLTGEEERYSHTDLWDFEANVQGSQAALEALRPLVKEKDPALLAQLDTSFSALNKLLSSHRKDGAFVSFTSLTPEQVKALAVALDAVGEPVSKLAGLVEKA